MVLPRPSGSAVLAGRATTGDSPHLTKLADDVHFAAFAAGLGSGPMTESIRTAAPLVRGHAACHGIPSRMGVAKGADT